jgi:NADPH:quinone reductase-like Zn-dependent oxidoreductase
MTKRDSLKRAPYVGLTDDQLMQTPTVVRNGLLCGQVVLVSGCGGGIGRAICYLFGRLDVVTTHAGGQAKGQILAPRLARHFKIER